MTDHQAKYLTLRRLIGAPMQTARVYKAYRARLGEPKAKWRRCWMVICHPMENGYRYTRKYFKLLREVKEYCQSIGVGWERM